MMKKLIGFSLMIMLLSFSINAQQNQRNFNKINDFTPEQRAALKAKKMALNFDLNTSQQKEVYNLMLQNAIDRKTAMAAMKQKKLDGAEISSTEKFEMQNQLLDKQMQHKAAMKNIMTKDQYEKWSASRNNNCMQGKYAKGKPQKNRENYMKNDSQQNRPKQQEN